MKIEDVYKEKINDLISRRGSTKFHITGIRHCDFKDKADEFIRDAAQKMLSVSFFPEKANPYDHEAVSCRHGRKQIGYVTTYDLEKYYILAVKDNADHLTGHFGRFSANIEDHLLKLYVPGSITLDDISQYRNKVNKQKDQLYGSWNHDAIDHFLVHSRHQDDAIACIGQLKEHVLTLYEGHGTCTREELMPLLQDYKDCSHYDISLEGQQERWDILLYLDYLHDFNHQPGLYRDDFYEGILKDVEDVISQIGGELVRSVSYKAYIERLTELVTNYLPASETAQRYLNTLPPEAFEDIRQQVDKFPHHLYRLFRTNPEEFVRTIYYARIPRTYLDPFLSGIALVQAFDKRTPKWQGPDETKQQQTTDDESTLPIPKGLDTIRAKAYFQKAIEKGYMKVENGKFSWIGVGLTGNKSQLAYFCGLVYGYKYSIKGNDGIAFPEKELNGLFGVSRMYSLLTQVYIAQKPQKWRTLIDELFE